MQLVLMVFDSDDNLFVVYHADNQSEAIVQEAINKIMASRDQTCIVIAHRLSTIRNADRIAFIAGGKVLEIGSHDELIVKPHGRYKRLFESSRRDADMSTAFLISQESKVKSDGKTTEEDEEIDWESKIAEDEEKAFKAARARRMAAPDKGYILLGSIGGVFAGAVFPLWGVVFSETINLLFRPVLPCTENYVPPPYLSCEEYWQSVADDMTDMSYDVALYWFIIMIGCLIGNVLAVYGFGIATERLSKRVRDSSFEAVLRQEIAYFDKRSVGTITSQLQDDAARIHAFSGEPVRSFIIAVSSIAVGVTLSFFVSFSLSLRRWEKHVYQTRH